MKPFFIIVLHFLFYEIHSFLFFAKTKKIAVRNLTSLLMKDGNRQQSGDVEVTTMPLSRRMALRSISILIATSSSFGHLLYASADEDILQKKPLTADQPLYLILRAREATEQETRLIKSGKFKDVQRSNVKLAVRFIVNNYRLSDNFIAAASFLPESKRYEATEVGQSATQALFTILEYFDASDVQNLKVGTFDNMAGKEDLVLKGLDAARASIDKFLAYFPKSTIENVQMLIQQENVLNEQEFDPDLGTIVNPNPKL